MEIQKLAKWIGIRVAKTTGSGELICYCPFHKGGMEKHPSFGINSEGLWNCFSCGRRGNLVHLVSAMKGITQQAAIRIIERKRLVFAIERKIDLPSWENRYKATKNTVFDENSIGLYDFALTHAKTREYLLERGLTREEMEEWDIRYDKWLKRIVFPIRNSRGRYVGAVGRGDSPRYLFYEGTQKSGCLYGIDKLDENMDYLYVVEGQIDTIRLSRYFTDIPQALTEGNVIGINGSHMSQYQANLITELSDKVILCLDNDDAGKSGTMVAVELLQHRVKLYIVDWSKIKRKGVKDVGDLSHKEMGKLISSTKFYLGEGLYHGKSI